MEFADRGMSLTEKKKYKILKLPTGLNVGWWETQEAKSKEAYEWGWRDHKRGGTWGNHRAKYEFGFVFEHNRKKTEKGF